MAKLDFDPITGKKIERWNSKTHSFSTAKTTSKIGCDDLYGHRHKSSTPREDYIKRANARNAETYKAVAEAQKRTGYKSRGNYKTTPKKDGLSIASIVLALISLISALEGEFHIIFIVLAIVFGGISLKKTGSKLAIVGIVIAILSFVMGAVMLFALFYGDLVSISAVTTNLN